MTEELNDVKIFTKFDIIPLAIIIGFSLLFSWLIAPFIWRDYSLGDYASLYTFSALIQAFAALFALVGMFVIFKLQSIDNKISDRKRMITDYVGGVLRVHGLYSSISELKVLASNPPEHLDGETKKKCKRLEKEEGWHQIFNLIEELQNSKFKIKVKFLKPLTLTLAVMILGIGMLPFSQNLHNNPSQELISVLIIAGLAIWGLIEMTYYIITALRA